MQVPYLTDSHVKMIWTVLDRHSRAILFLGTTNKPIDNKNPYPFEFRKQMIEKEFEGKCNLSIVPLPDNPSDTAWVGMLDSIITSFLAYDESAVLYGGRDSFIPFYTKEKGKFECVELAPTDYDSGTELRTLKSIELPSYSPEAATAILWTLRQVQK
jgi:hypothetical protein